MTEELSREVQALVVRQWLDEWDEVRFSAKDHRRPPEPFFYVFSLPAMLLWRISDIHRRRADRPRAEDTSIQRGHSKGRSREIQRFVHGGFPWADLTDSQKRSKDYEDLRMPGWLPTAIVANILPPGTERRGRVIDENDVITVSDINGNKATLTLPKDVYDRDWLPKVAPIEIIDGQHRLLAFEGENQLDGAFELPVVAFRGLDFTWQAYLFYTINIKPKRINASLAYDLYPLLRVQDWLEQAPDKASIYRETRAQELTEVLWSHPESPWRSRINMLGESKAGPVTQAAFIRSLIASYIKKWEGRGIGGLFGSPLREDLPSKDASTDVLQWSRPQQAAFLILVWENVANAVKESADEWAISIRTIPGQAPLPFFGPFGLDPAFAGKYSLLATDQGVRGIMQVTNDMCYIAAEKLRLTELQSDEEASDGDLNEIRVSGALQEMRAHPVAAFLGEIASVLSRFDWRTSSTPNLDENSRRQQAIFRGSGGYKELRRQLVILLTSSPNEDIRITAEDVRKRLGY